MNDAQWKIMYLCGFMPPGSKSEYAIEVDDPRRFDSEEQAKTTDVYMWFERIDGEPCLVISTKPHDSVENRDDDILNSLNYAEFLQSGRSMYEGQPDALVNSQDDYIATEKTWNVIFEKLKDNAFVVLYVFAYVCHQEGEES